MRLSSGAGTGCGRGASPGAHSGAITAASAATTAALKAGMTSLVSRASVSMINNGGDLGAVLKDLGSSDLEGFCQIVNDVLQKQRRAVCGALQFSSNGLCIYVQTSRQFAAQPGRDAFRFERPEWEWHARLLTQPGLKTVRLAIRVQILRFFYSTVR